ncbi:MAG: hypothetical protein QGH06_05115 [Lutibacter sp.]|jgi:hypothetical protein|nr:hypothetical protein [Lutibacter sp.]
MKLQWLLLVGLLTVVGCSKKEIKIPVLFEKGIQEVNNHSQVWIFFETVGQDTLARVNRNNTISATHWIYHIDRRLPLQSFVHSLEFLIEKHAGSIHSEKGMHDYFSYSDTLAKKISYIAFDQTKYQTDSILSKDYIRRHPALYRDYHSINLTFNPDNVLINEGAFDKEGFKTLLAEFIDFSSTGRPTMLHLNFNNSLLYQDYLYYKSLVNSLCNERILCNPIEFVFDQQKVPDCECK